MADIGYVRVSTLEQNVSRQLDGVALKKVFADRCSGGDTNRPELIALMEFVREGDTVHVHSIDRLARNSQDLLRLVDEFKALGVTLHFHREALTFTTGDSDPIGELMFTMLGAFAQFERSILKERQREGIEKAKQKGVYKGAKRRIDRVRVLAMLSQGIGPSVIARELSIGRKSVYRIKEEAGS
mgnify:CR=1 FL=1